MQFVNPIWFSALVALSIPVLIHLWNIRPGKTLKVGSISIFAESSPASSRSLKLLDILLLILRCLLLAVVALLLAAPFLQRKADRSAKGWILIPPNYFNQAYQQYKTQIDSLNRKGYELHYFDAGFPKQKLDEVLKNTLKSKTVSDSTNYWLLASQLDEKAPANIKIEVFAPNTTANFQGNQPAANHTFNWHTFAPADSVKTWLSDAWVTDNGGIRVTQGTAKPSGIRYQFADIRSDNSNALYSVNTTGGQASVHLKSADSIQTVVNGQTVELAIYTGNNEADANYLRAALEAASKFMLQKTQVKVYHQPEQIPANVDWLFWLSETPLQAKDAKHILYYASGKASNNGSWLVNNDAERPQLYKSIVANSTNEQPVWTDATGNVILGEKQSGKSTSYPFYTHFNPTWTDLVWNDAFPKWILKLLTPEPEVALKNDTRSLDRQQIELNLSANKTSFGPQAINVDVSQYLWYLLALLFFAERWLAHKTQTTNG